MFEETENSLALKTLKGDLEGHIGQLIVVEQKDLISHGLDYPETIINMAYIGIIDYPFLILSGTRLFIPSTVYSAILPDGKSVLFHCGRPPIGAYPFPIEIADFAKELISREGRDYGFKLRFTIGNQAVLGRSGLDLLYTKHIDEFSKYYSITGTP